MARSNLTVKFLGEMLQDMQLMTERLHYTNPVMERYLKFRRGVELCDAPIQGMTSKSAEICQAALDHSIFCHSPSTSGATAP